MALKAIETRHNGYRFRSRLEARWSIFFEAMGWEYIYEPEGFVLPNGRRYLPDFFFPDFGWWAEIKGEYPTEEEQGIVELCTTAGLQLYLLYGPCESEAHGALWYETFPDGSQGCHDYDNVSFATCRRCERGIWIRSDEVAIPWQPCDDSCLCDKWPLPNTAIMEAYRLAKSARFEHGAASKL